MATHFKEINHISTTMILLASLQNLTSLTPSKSMAQKSNHDFKEKYPYVRVGTLEPMRVKDILKKNSCFIRTPGFRIRVRHLMT